LKEEQGKHKYFSRRNILPKWRRKDNIKITFKESGNEIIGGFI
jgi:hypothetical protein